MIQHLILQLFQITRKALEFNIWDIYCRTYINFAISWFSTWLAIIPRLYTRYRILNTMDHFMVKKNIRIDIICNCIFCALSILSCMVATALCLFIFWWDKRLVDRNDGPEGSYKQCFAALVYFCFDIIINSIALSYSPTLYSLIHKKHGYSVQPDSSCGLQRYGNSKTFFVWWMS